MNRRDTILALVASGTAAWPLASLAQQGKVWHVGFLSLTPASLNSQNTDAFLKGMRELGYLEGKNLVMEWRIADGKFDRLPGLATELVQSKVDVIVAVASPAISAAQKATSTIPIVMATTGDPVSSGFVKSLARPGGNITGLSNMGGDTGAKDVDLLLSVIPKLPRWCTGDSDQHNLPRNIGERRGWREERGSEDAGGRGVDPRGDRERVLYDGPGERRGGYRGGTGNRRGKCAMRYRSCTRNTPASWTICPPTIVRIEPSFFSDSSGTLK
jgi:hypothetical protein